MPITSITRTDALISCRRSSIIWSTGISSRRTWQTPKRAEAPRSREAPPPRGFPSSASRKEGPMATVRQKQSANQDEEIVEKGDIFFFYRPRVEHMEAEGPEDIQRFYMVLKPEGGTPFRVAVLGRKRLPDPDHHERIWGFIDRLAKRGEEIEADLKEQHYETKTRGERTLPAARPAGEGVCALVSRGRNLYRAYYLEP